MRAPHSRLFLMEDDLFMKKAVLMLLVIALLVFPFAALGQTMEPYETIDLDLSQMSGTIAYAQVYQMISDPEAYVGKIIRMTGYFDVFEDQDTGIVYTSCIIPDAAACCAQGFEFVWAGDHAWPEAYPEPGTYLTVTGRFETYLEDDWMYIHLVDADVEWEAKN